MGFEYKKDGHVAIFTINLPDQMNAMNLQAFRDWADAMADFRDDGELLVGIFTGAGEKAFCAGANINEVLPFLKENAHKMWAWPQTNNRKPDMYKPLIAAINGLCIGEGMEIALGCDLRVAGEKAKFGLPEVTLGIVPGDGGTQRLPRAIPRCKAAEMLLTGAIFDAEEAWRIGLVNKVVPVDEVMSEAMAYAKKICKAAPLAVRAAKEAMNRGVEMSLDEGLKLEYSLNSFLTHTRDHAEGVASFAEKRKPQYSGE